MNKSILILTKHLFYGGVEKMLYRILQIWSRKGYQIDISILYRKIMPLNWEKYCRKISFLFEEESLAHKEWLVDNPDTAYVKMSNGLKYDIEICFREGATAKILAHSTNKDSIKISWVHSVFTEDHYSISYYSNKQEEADCYNIFDRIVFCSNAAMNGFDIQLKKSSAGVIYSPIDIDTCNLLANQSCIFNINVPYYLVLSRFSEKKGINRIIPIVQALPNQNTIVVCGDGPLYYDVQTQIIQKNLQNKLWIHHSIINPFPLLLNCRALLLPSKYESFGLSLQEGLILGKPVIATDTSGAREVLNNTNFGFLTENSAEAFSSALCTLTNDDELLFALEKKAIYGQLFWTEQAHLSRIQLENILSH